MTISDIIFDSIYSIIDDVIHYYDNPEDIYNDYNMIELIGHHLRITDRMDYFRPTEQQLKIIENHDWDQSALELLRDHLNN